jgi:hypothetical protein
VGFIFSSFLLGKALWEIVEEMRRKEEGGERYLFTCCKSISPWAVRKGTLQFVCPGEARGKMEDELSGMEAVPP